MTKCYIWQGATKPDHWPILQSAIWNREGQALHAYGVPRFKVVFPLHFCQSKKREMPKTNLLQPPGPTNMQRNIRTVLD